MYYEGNCFIIKKEAAIESYSLKQVFCKNIAALQYKKKAWKNNYEGVHFSKTAGLLPATLRKMSSFTGIFQLFSNINTNIYLAEHVSLATPESISYRRIKNYRSSHRKLLFIFGFTQTLTKKCKK